MNDLERFTGVGWGSEGHQACVMGRTSAVLAERVFRHGGTGLAEKADWIVATAGAEPQVTGIAIEVPHGPVVETLREPAVVVVAKPLVLATLLAGAHDPLRRQDCQACVACAMLERRTMFTPNLRSQGHGA